MRIGYYSTCRVVICMLLMAVLPGQAAWAGSIYSSQDFESTSFTVGTLNGQDANGQGTWLVVVAPVDDANIVNDFSRYGQQSIQLKNSGNRVVARLLRYSGITTNHYADAWIYPPRIEEVAYNTTLQYRDGAGVIIGNVQFTKSGTITVNGVNQGVQYRPNEWNRITVGFDMVNSRMNVYVNHQLAYTDTPMFAAPSGGIRYYDFDWTGTGVGTEGQKGPYMDHFYISDENPLLFVSDFGAVGDGVTDDKPEIQTALNTVKVAPYTDLDNVTVVFDPDKTYMLGSSPSNWGEGLTLAVASNFTIEGQNAVLLIHPSIPPNGAGFGIRFDRCNNARLLNLVADGNRAARGDGGQVWGHNIIFNAAEDMLIDRVISLNASVDGFMIDATTQTDPATFSKRLHFIRCGAYNCNRQGMSIINSKDMVVEDSWFHGTHGLDPQAGIDIEANVGSAVPGNSNVVIKGCSFTQNAGFGLQISGAGGGCVNITVEKNSFEDNYGGALSLGASYSKVIGNTFGPSSGSVVGRVLDLPISGTANHDNLIADNRFINLDHIPSPDNRVQKLIYVHSGAGNNNVIINNAFIDCDLEPLDVKIISFNPTTITRNNTVDGAPYDAVYGQ